MSTEELPVGPELDAAVARALGWTEIEVYALASFAKPPMEWADRHSGRRAICFSGSAANAWEVVEYLRGRGWYLIIDAAATGYTISAAPPTKHTFIPYRWQINNIATMPEAVCRVVLLAGDALKGKNNE